MARVETRAIERELDRIRSDPAKRFLSRAVAKKALDLRPWSGAAL